MKYIKLYLSLLVCIFSVSLVFAQNETLVDSSDDIEPQGFFITKIDYQIRASFSIGGTSPLGLPQEIREIKSYDPKLQLGLEVNSTKWVAESDWGIRLGIGFQDRGMETKARVKNYWTKIIQDNAEVGGYFTGDVKTEVKNTYLNIPLSAVFRVNERWNLYGGLYAQFLISKQFEGTVKNGHFRQGTPIGPKLTFEEGEGAPYDFSKDQRRFLWGTQIGAEWQLKNKHFKLFPQITYGFNGIFPSDFDALDFSMHNIYLDLGFGYQF